MRTLHTRESGNVRGTSRLLILFLFVLYSIRLYCAICVLLYHSTINDTAIAFSPRWMPSAGPILRNEIDISVDAFLITFFIYTPKQVSGTIYTPSGDILA